jgi:antitoxin YefM
LYHKTEEVLMSIQTTYTQARANLASLCDRASADREVVFINRRNAEPVALVAASELAGLLETAHLLRSPKNAARLLAVLARGEDELPKPQSIEELRRELNLD